MTSILSELNIFNILFGGIITLYSALIIYVFNKISKVTFEIQNILAERKEKLTEFSEFLEDYIGYELEDIRNDRRNYLILVFLTFFTYIICTIFPLGGNLPTYMQIFKWIILPLIFSIVIIIILYWVYLFYLFYEDRLAKLNGIAKSPPNRFTSLLDRLKYTDEKEREERILMYDKYKDTKSENDKKKLFEIL